jgi:hypothetical protein
MCGVFYAALEAAMEAAMAASIDAWTSLVDCLWQVIRPTIAPLPIPVNRSPLAGGKMTPSPLRSSEDDVS